MKRPDAAATPHPRDASRAMSDALWASLGQAGGMLAGLISAWLVPRLLGPTDYGDWVLLRGLMSFVISFTGLGTSEIVARFYIARLAAGRADDAGRLFKFVAQLRFGLTALAIVTWLALAWGRVRLPGGGADLAWLAVGVTCQSLTLVSLLLLYGHRDFPRLALFHTLQPALTPLLVVAAHRLLGGFSAVPAAVAMGDALALTLVSGLAVRRWRWPAGALARREKITLLGFGGLAGLATFGLGAFYTVMPYLMNLRGYDSTAIGFAGLSGRLVGLLSMALGTLGAGIFPSLTHVLESDGTERMLRWHDLSTRAGMTLCLTAIGTLALAGGWLVPAVFGAGYAAAVPTVTLGMVIGAPLWLGGQCTRLALLLRRPSVPAWQVTALFAAFLAALLSRPPDANGLTAMAAAVAGAAAHALTGVALLWRHQPWRRAVRRFALPIGVTLLALAVGSSVRPTAGPTVGAVTGWLALLTAALVISGVFTRWEAASVIRAARGRRAAPKPAMEDRAP